MSSVVAGAEVVLELCAEHLRDSDIFDENAVLAVGVVAGEGLRGDVFGDPVGVSCAAVVGRSEGCGGAEVIYRTGEAILEEAAGVDLFMRSVLWIATLRGRKTNRSLRRRGLSTSYNW